MMSFLDTAAVSIDMVYTDIESDGYSTFIILVRLLLILREPIDIINNQSRLVS